MKKAFTLIELLIVIAIIGILAGILFVSIGQTPLIKARDSKRLSELQAIRTALTLYYTDNNAYPATTDGVLALVSGGYLQAQPIAPRSSQASGTCASYTPNVPSTVADFVAGDYGYRYEQQSAGQDYLLQTCLELTGNTALATDANTGNSPIYDISP